MRKKLLGVFGILCVVAMLTIPTVSAKPTSAANNPEAMSFVWHSEYGSGTPVEVMTNPAWAEGEEIIVTHMEEVWNLNPEGNNYVQIGDGEEIPIDAEEGYEGTVIVQIVSNSPGIGALNYRVYEKIMWDDNYIEIMCHERASYDMTGPVPEFYASGTFNGIGEIDGQKVQVTGIREGILQPAGIVLECYGTIRFAGNTA